MNIFNLIFAITGIIGLPQEAQNEPGDFAFFQSLEIAVSASSKTWRGIGRLDAYGRNIVEQQIGWNNSEYNGHYPELYTITTTSVNVYRYAAGRLIPGELVWGKGFVPKLTGSIISIDEYIKSKHFTPQHSVPRLDKREYHSNDCMEVYNLPGFFYDRNQLKRYNVTKNAQPLPFPIQPGVIQTSPARGTIEYTYTPATIIKIYSSPFGIERSQRYQCVYEKDNLISDLDKIVSTESKQQLPRWCEPRTPNESVYELCNNRLIPGFLYKIPIEEVLCIYTNLSPSLPRIISIKAADNDFVFVPDLGGVILDMQKYLDHYDPKLSRRIHNLSGEIKPVAK